MWPEARKERKEGALRPAAQRDRRVSTTAPFNSGEPAHFGARQLSGDRHCRRADRSKRNTGELSELYMKDESARAVDLEFAFR
jgi:hypothetical protein